MASNQTKYGFRPSQRLLTKRQFDDVFAQSQVRAAVPEILLLASERLSKETTKGPRLGFIVPKKKIRHAVGRNLFKRIFREQFRHLNEHYPALDLVVLARAGSQSLNTEVLHQSAIKLFDKVKKRYLEKNIAS